MALKDSYPFLNEQTIEFINDLTKDLTDFDEEKFKKWLILKDIEHKTNPSNYLRKAFQEHLDKGTFKKDEDQEVHVAITPLCNDLRSLGVHVAPESTMGMSVAMDYLLNNKILTIEELRTLNRGIISYLVDHKDTMDTNNYLELMRKSNMLKGRMVDWVAIGKEITKANEEWDQLIKELEEHSPSNAEEED